MSDDIELIHDGSHTIKDGEVYVIDFEEGDSDEVVITIDVVEGPKVDINLTDARGYQRYMDGYEYNTFGVAAQTPAKKETLRFEPDGTHYHLIIECNGSPGIRPIISEESSTVQIGIGVR